MSKQLLPRDIMKSTLWSFTGKPFDNLEAFSEEVRQYQIEIIDKDAWLPNSVVLPVSRVLVVYSRWSDESKKRCIIELTSANGRDFTAADLLFKIHNAVVDQVRDDDHHFFEGLSLNSAPLDMGPPLYLLNLGS